MKTITKKPIGSIEVKERHRTQKGFIFRSGQILEYYTISRISESCGCSTPTTFHEFYETKYGLLPTNKATKI